MKRSSTLAVFVVTLSLFLAGCGGGPVQNGLVDPFIGGTEGVVMSFMEQAPPTEIFDNGDTTFVISVKVQNNGESDVGPDAMIPPDNNWAEIEIQGINPLQFGSPQTVRTLSEEGVSLTRMRKNFDGSLIAGTPDVITFDNFQYLPDNVGNNQVMIRANICYDYTTFTNTQVCLKSNTLETVRDNSICTLAGPRDVKNSGAPVHVTTVSQAPLGKNKIQLTFTIENVGSGTIFAPSDRPVGSTGSLFGRHCDQSQQNQNRNQVYVRVVLNDEQSTGLISCNRLSRGNEGIVQLFGGQPTVLTCTLETPEGIGSQAYTDLLRIDLDYAYSQYIETPVLIRDVSSGLQ